jgi:tetratricopeptide (TPR) repeat protein
MPQPEGGVMGNAQFKCMLGIMGVLLVLACGPDTILVRPGLDTPDHHVSNGNQLLDRLKLEAAYQEFQRALELDPSYTPAYIGVAMVQGRRGDYDGGLKMLNKAKKTAQTQEESQMVEEAYKQFFSLFKDQTN